jgi:hypothetical protein
VYKRGFRAVTRASKRPAQPGHAPADEDNIKRLALLGKHTACAYDLYHSPIGISKNTRSGFYRLFASAAHVFKEALALNSM